MKTVANKNLKDAVIEMDEHYYVNCTLSDCVLLFSGGDFGLVECQIVNCEVRLAGAARKTIQFLKRLTTGCQPSETNGTITIESRLVN